MLPGPKRIVFAIVALSVFVTLLVFLYRSGEKTTSERETEVHSSEPVESKPEPTEKEVAKTEPPVPVVPKPEPPPKKKIDPKPKPVEEKPPPPELEEEPELVASPLYFPGGDSDISSDDGERARKAIAKWTNPEGRQDDQPLSGDPFFWDASKVGRPVFLRILKNRNDKGILEVWLENPETERFELFKSYAVARYSGELGPKTAEGDWQAPEGFYFINRGRMNPFSDYHLSMDMGYPNRFDQELERTGSYLMIHGSSVSVGCYAMTDCSIEQIYTLVDRALAGGQAFVRVHCFPFAMTKENLGKNEDSGHIEFWQNLKEGWDWFEKHRRPPNAEVEEGKYVFSEG